MKSKFFLVTDYSPVYKDDIIIYFNVTLNEMNNDKSLVEDGEEFKTAIFNNDTGDDLLFFALMKNLKATEETKSPVIVHGNIVIVPANSMTLHIATNCIINKK